MASRISTGDSIKEKTNISIGYTNRCPTKSYLDGYSSLTVSDSYSSNQLVPIDWVNRGPYISYENKTMAPGSNNASGAILCNILTNDPNGWLCATPQYYMDYTLIIHPNSGYNGTALTIDYETSGRLRPSISVEFTYGLTGNTVYISFSLR